MYHYDFELGIQANKHLTIEASSEEEAMQMLDEILDKEIIPIEPEDNPVVEIIEMDSIDDPEYLEF